ncbi:hypothetical protein AB6A40_006809 [Gnathostoma spinigerum]|uniref:UBP-type domain-containing protein n=1 Tax=Gnathostoma spinigerum TaxID=75299 RepID=A0ABD6EV29_9BILA
MDRIPGRTMIATVSVPANEENFAIESSSAPVSSSCTHKNKKSFIKSSLVRKNLKSKIKSNEYEKCEECCRNQQSTTNNHGKLWICVTCGQISCEDSKHALKHSEADRSGVVHPIQMCIGQDCFRLAVLTFYKMKVYCFYQLCLLIF